MAQRQIRVAVFEDNVQGIDHPSGGHRESGRSAENSPATVALPQIATNCLVDADVSGSAAGLSGARS